MNQWLQDGLKIRIGNILQESNIIKQDNHSILQNLHILEIGWENRGASKEKEVQIDSTHPFQ